MLWSQLHAVDPRWSADRVAGVFGAGGVRCGRGQWRSFVKLRFLGALGDGMAEGRLDSPTLKALSQYVSGERWPSRICTPG